MSFEGLQIIHHCEFEIQDVDTSADSDLSAKLGGSDEMLNCSVS